MKRIFGFYLLFSFVLPVLVQADVLTRPLHVGSKGDDVSYLQTFLKAKGYFTYPTITGFYGAVTYKAVANFQKDNGLEQVGSVGPKTRALINSSTSASPNTTTSSSTASTTVTIPPLISPSSTTSPQSSICVFFFCPGNGYTPGFGGGGGGGSSVTVVAAPANSVLPSISGTVSDGSTLTVDVGTWSGIPTFTYQWKADGSSITNASTSTYLLTGDEVNKVITVTITATNSGGSVSATSAATGAVASNNLPGFSTPSSWLNLSSGDLSSYKSVLTAIEANPTASTIRGVPTSLKAIAPSWAKIGIALPNGWHSDELDPKGSWVTKQLNVAGGENSDKWAINEAVQNTQSFFYSTNLRSALDALGFTGNYWEFHLAGPWWNSAGYPSWVGTALSGYTGTGDLASFQSLIDHRINAMNNGTRAPASVLRGIEVANELTKSGTSDGLRAAGDGTSGTSQWAAAAATVYNGATNYASQLSMIHDWFTRAEAAYPTVPLGIADFDVIEYPIVDNATKLDASTNYNVGGNDAVAGYNAAQVQWQRTLTLLTDLMALGDHIDFFAAQGHAYTNRATNRYEIGRKLITLNRLGIVPKLTEVNSRETGISSNGSPYMTANFTDRSDRLRFWSAYHMWLMFSAFFTYSKLSEVGFWTSTTDAGTDSGMTLMQKDAANSNVEHIMPMYFALARALSDAAAPNSRSIPNQFWLDFRQIAPFYFTAKNGATASTAKAGTRLSTTVGNLQMDDISPLRIRNGVVNDDDMSNGAFKVTMAGSAVPTATSTILDWHASSTNNRILVVWGKNGTLEVSARSGGNVTIASTTVGTLNTASSGRNTFVIKRNGTTGLKLSLNGGAVTTVNFSNGSLPLLTRLSVLGDQNGAGTWQNGPRLILVSWNDESGFSSDSDISTLSTTEPETYAEGSLNLWVP